MDWSPTAIISSASPKAEDSVPSTGDSDHILSSQIKECGDKVRDMKAHKAEKVLFLPKTKVFFVYLYQ